jgi:hypothetical protein
MPTGKPRTAKKLTASCQWSTGNWKPVTGNLKEAPYVFADSTQP